MLRFIVGIPWINPDGSEGVRYLSQGGEVVEGIEGNPPDNALSLCFRAARIKDRKLIEAKQLEYAGGLDALLEIQRAAASSRVLVIKFLQSLIGDEKATTDQLEAMIPATLDNPDFQILYQKMVMFQNNLRRLEILARYDVLIVDPPAGWASLGDREEIPGMDLVLVVGGAWEHAQAAGAKKN